MDGMDRTEKAGRENREEERLELALQTLRSFLLGLAAQAGEGEEYGERLWQGIRQSAGLLQELAYYHDRGEFLCRYEVAGYTLADVLVCTPPPHTGTGTLPCHGSTPAPAEAPPTA